MVPGPYVQGFRKLAVTLLPVLFLITRSVIVSDAQRGAGRGAAADPKTQALKDAIDIHVHSYPDNTMRSVDVFEAATLAKANGMRGLVLKNHYDQTAGYVYLVRKAVPGLEVFGGIDLNLPVGGMNPHAVE